MVFPLTTYIVYILTIAVLPTTLNYVVLAQQSLALVLLHFPRHLRLAHLHNNHLQVIINVLFGPLDLMQLFCIWNVSFFSFSCDSLDCFQPVCIKK